MASPFVQVFQDAEIDAISLSEFMWKPANVMVVRRLAPSIHTLNYYLTLFDASATELNNKVATFDAILIQKSNDAQVRLDKQVVNAQNLATSNAMSVIAKSELIVQSAVDALINDAGFIIVDSFELGATITQRNQALRYSADGKLYRWAGDLPKVMPVGSTPINSGGLGTNAWLEVSDISLRQQIATDKGFKELTGQMVGNAYGIPAPLIDMQLKTGVVSPADYFDNYFWGTAAGRVKKSVDGSTWVDVCNSPTTFLRLIPTSDGEVLGLDTEMVRKSTGWGTASVTWRVVLTNTASGTVAPFRAWSFDGDGDKFIISHYGNSLNENWPESRYVWISLDAGNTFNVAWDTAEKFPSQESTSHLHAACYDKWLDRFWFAEGHGAMVGLRWSDDNGVTWTRLQNDLNMSPAFTVMIPTDFGIVCGTDSAENGIYVMQRAANPETTGVKLYGKWTADTDRRSLYGFADRGFRDPDTGIVYVGWVSAGAEIPAVIMACGSGGAGVVCTAPDNNGDNLLARFNNIVAAKGVIIGTLETHKDAGNFIAKTSKFNAPTLLDNGNILSSFGEETSGSSFRIGFNSVSKGIDGIAIGNGANSGNDDFTTNTVAIGRNSKTISTNTIAIGSNAKSLETSGIAIGETANVTGAFGIALGKSASSVGDSGIAAGNNAIAQNDTISLGRDANKDATSVDVNSVAIGSYSKSLGGGATAVGFTAIAVANLDTAFGAYSKAKGANGVSFGAYSECGTSSVSIGFGSLSNSTGSVSIGSEADTSSASAYNIAIGSKSLANTGESIAVGREAKSTGYAAIAIGSGAKTDSSGSIAIGHLANTVSAAAFNTALGGAATATGGQATAIGRNSKAIGYGSVALGDGTEVSKVNTVGIGERDLELAKIGGKIYLKSPNGTSYAISVGDDGVVIATTV